MRYPLLAVLFYILATGCTPHNNQVDLVRLRSLKDQAFTGDPESQYLLGVHYTQNSQWAWDHSRGYNWFLDAAEAGHPGAQYMVGIAKLLGRGTTSDPQGAVQWFEKAASKGHARSQYQLGLAFLNGHGAAKDESWGRQWLEQAALNNHKEAQFLLAALFNKGIGGRVNRHEAWRWLKAAEKNGHPQAVQALVAMQTQLPHNEEPLSKPHLKPALPKELSAVPLWRYLQATLNNRGYNAGEEDGIRGPLTEQAIANYTAENKLPRSIRLEKLVEHLRGRE